VTSLAPTNDRLTPALSQLTGIDASRFVHITPTTQTRSPMENTSERRGVPPYVRLPRSYHGYLGYGMLKPHRVMDELSPAIRPCASITEWQVRGRSPSVNLRPMRQADESSLMRPFQLATPSGKARKHTWKHFGAPLTIKPSCREHLHSHKSQSSCVRGRLPDSAPLASVQGRYCICSRQLLADDGRLRRRSDLDSDRRV